MKRKESVIKKSHLSILLLLLIVGIGIGFAALQTQLQINGNTTINEVTWDVHFEEANKTDNSTVEGEVEILEDTTKAQYTVTLEEPGDIYEFTIDVVNKGSIDAILKDYETNEDLEEDEDVYLVYEVTGIPEKNTLLKKQDGKYTITVKVQYNPDIVAEDLPKEPKVISKLITLDYIQYKNSDLDGQGIEPVTQP